MKERDTAMMWQTFQSSQQYFAFKNYWQRIYLRGMTRKHNIRVEASNHELSGVFWIIVLCKDDSTQTSWFSPTTAGTTARAIQGSAKPAPKGIPPPSAQHYLGQHPGRTILLPSPQQHRSLHRSPVHRSQAPAQRQRQLQWFPVIPDKSEQHTIYL